ncbi:hypothetical protein GQX74_002298 [Glossina fuscipes]|nr:hypothetical protein GQX74_002298 [Glossina fuscipes]
MGGGPVFAIVPAVVNIDTLNPKFSPQLQGLRHTPLTHDLSVEQSVSAIHPPTSLTVFVGLHVPLPLLTYPSGHIQIIVRTGAVGVTSHSAGLLHGSKVKQGSTHSSFMHAKRAGQSVSALQVGSGSGLQSISTLDRRCNPEDSDIWLLFALHNNRPRSRRRHLNMD